MRRSALLLFFPLLILVCGSSLCRGQAAESAEARSFHIDAGAMGSAFQPDDGNNWLFGAGTYVDFHFSHWAQVEAEGRWLRYNQYFGEHQDDYLIGPRVPIVHLGGRGQLYGKAMIGLGSMTFPFSPGSWGHFTALAFGGSADFRMSQKVTFRAVDFEYQDWPVWLPHESLQPYGVSVGVAYRVF